MKLPVLKIGNLVAQVPIIQGGMAIRLSTARLAAAVANEGGIGLIAASGMEEQELRTEIRLARKLTNGKGIIGINCMVAARAFKNLIVTAAQEGVDLIVAGAGFSRDIFAVGREYNVAVVPIVSSVKLAKISEKLGASAIVVEGTEAGGHLGTQQSIKEILPDIAKAVKIPVIAAGGATCGKDIVDLLNLGADGVQMGSRFAASEESNGARFLKEMYLRMVKEDVVQIDSPVGYKGRAIRSPFAQLSLEGRAPLPVTCDACLKHCTHQFCIIRALSRAQQGDVETGLIFTGAHMWKIHEILPVKEIFRRIKDEVSAINS
ncbi:NAD(P)H-dependent flavin oxidoreductase [Succiniclasticum ruminis]|uniref:Probable nitronate monooxygenase n=1 Tax=Succiniclasticum ruminis DSM 9236 TaxID=1123323 RepID=A0A1I1ZPJ0_9FIRM|nr:nitronate monooxygenase [Succiniclasticum ruminis]SFE33585.1 NAD(P)H-dependent flavin oxidoreductase YrpB, nitropropane dioxygenase family [Succiniclasticum ruminis DSM 9236]